MSDDSIDGIYSTLRQCALISKTAGGIGLSVCVSFVFRSSSIVDLVSRNAAQTFAHHKFAVVVASRRCVCFSSSSRCQSYIRGTNGSSNGLVPMLRVFNDTARYVDQGGGKRKGSFAVYLEPWHADVFEFLELKVRGIRASFLVCFFQFFRRSAITAPKRRVRATFSTDFGFPISLCGTISLMFFAL